MCFGTRACLLSATTEDAIETSWGKMYLAIYLHSCYNEFMANELETKWVAAWRRAGEKMAELRRDELRNIDTQQALLNLADAYESCRLHHPPRPTSGLVEQQRWFRKLRP
jgi:hypothetical protein